MIACGQSKLKATLGDMRSRVLAEQNNNPIDTNSHGITYIYILRHC